MLRAQVTRAGSCLVSSSTAPDTSVGKIGKRRPADDSDVFTPRPPHAGRDYPRPSAEALFPLTGVITAVFLDRFTPRRQHHLLEHLTEEGVLRLIPLAPFGLDERPGAPGRPPTGR